MSLNSDFDQFEALIRRKHPNFLKELNRRRNIRHLMRLRPLVRYFKKLAKMAIKKGPSYRKTGSFVGMSDLKEITKDAIGIELITARLDLDFFDEGIYNGCSDMFTLKVDMAWRGRNGGATSTSRNHNFVDYPQPEKFADLDTLNGRILACIVRWARDIQVSNLRR